MTMPLEVKEESLLKLVKIQKEKNLCRVIFSDDSSLLCSEDDLFEYKLYKDALISQEDYQTLKEKNTYYLCLNDAIVITNIKFYSKLQVINRLINKGHQKIVIDKVIEKLEDIKVIDDEAFYDSYVEFKIRQGYGPVYIKNKLHNLGIDRYVEMSYDVQYEIIEQLFHKSNPHKTNYQVFTKKFTNKLIAQGFDLNIINDVLNNNVFESNHDVIKNEYLKLKNKYEEKYDKIKLKYFIKNKLLQKGYSSDEINKIMEEDYND
ncbi:RecX family transcriptional regulator [Erysipelotrichaceae bacterium OttesenSCG-928-M19]|nr:RecX family transcriptional regulator [Erysipelotrichaceae bacterium OttesenSCG-928-M19]